MKKSLAVTAAAALVAALPLSAGAVTFAGNLVDSDLTPGSGAENTYDILAGPYAATAQFELGDSAGEWAFDFINNSSTDVIVKSTTTVNQLAGSFDPGGATSFVTGTPDRNTAAGHTEAFERIFTIAAGDTVTVGFFFDDPTSVGTSGFGPSLTAQVSASPIPLPASMLMLLGALGGLGFVGFASRRRGATAA